MADLLTHSPPDDDASQGRAAYGRFLKPRVAEMLEAVGLDVTYSRAEGDYLFHRDASGSEVKVLDMLGGFGASLFGHNHPVLVARAQEVLAARRPFNAQASVRSLAGKLAERLSERVKRATGRDYVVTLAATGTEAIEAALKLAEMDRGARVERCVAELVRVGRANGSRLAPGALERAARFLGEPIASADDLVTRVAAYAKRVLDVPPQFLSLEKAFHGKSTGALSLTANARFRDTWRHIGVRTTFLPVGDEGALQRAIDKARIPYLALRFDPKVGLDVAESSFVGIAAAFAEPIQGEGGVRAVPDGYLRALRAAADAHGFLFVLDEIQCGMGRTGAFLASEPSGVRGDAYALSKSLGGGLAKISALLVDRARYDAELGLLHTSTFAEDDYSSAVALAALELLDHDGGALLRACAEKGEHLRSRLRALVKKYPSQLREVRGRGLMVGLELARFDDSASPFLRVASEQELLGYVIAGHLLHEEQIRVAPTLSSPETLRLQPSAYVETAELDRFCAAIERIAVALRDRDVMRLTAHLAGRAPPHPPAPSPMKGEGEPPVSPPLSPRGRGVGGEGSRRPRVAFLAHFLDPENLRDWEPGFASLSPDECRAMLERTRRALGPFVVHEGVVRSAQGGEVDVTVIGLAFSPEQVMASLRKGDAKWARDLVARGVELAKERGARVVGFGGYTSIVTDNCRDFAHEEAVVTSGNSLTSAATVEAVLAAKARLGLGRVRLGVVGALGNIGAVLAELLAAHVDEIVLVGRAGATRRLEERAQALRSSIGGARISVTTELADLRACNVIVAATNAPQPIVAPEHLGPGPVLICDVAVPGDVDPRALGERPDVTVLAGGMVSLPLGQQLRIRGMPTDGNEIYGCLAETILTGLAGLRTSLSLGALRATDVRSAGDLARAHGFGFGEKPARTGPIGPQPRGTTMPILGATTSGFDVYRAGKKAGNLHLMAAAGFAVPAGFVVFPEHDVAAMEDGALAELVTGIGGFPVAVRSSGLLEDLAGASFAGQYETFLGVRDVAELRGRIEACRASANSPRVRAYLEKNELDPADALVSVLVQRMVDARAAGVGFSIHPLTGREEHALVECVGGLGEKLVSGHATPSRYVIELVSGAVVEATQGADGALLSGDEAREIARALLDLQALFHAPQDVELAIDRAGKLWLLQSRPITRIQWRTDVDELTNADFKDGGISARVCTPMMYSLYRDAFQGSMQRYIEAIKLAREKEQWISSYYGRGYWNASAIKRALARVPGFDEAKFDRDLGIQKDYGARGPVVVPTDARTVVRAIPVAIALEQEYRRQLRAVVRFAPWFRHERRKWQGRIAAFAQTSDDVFFDDLTGVVRELHLQTEQAYFTTIYNNQNMQSDFKSAVAKLDEVTGGSTKLALLMSGLDDIRHMDVQRGFVALHRVVKLHGFGSVEWSRALAEFLAEHGFHADAELELTCPRWSEDPSRVIAHVEMALQAGVEPADPDRTVASQRRQFEGEARAIEERIASNATWRVRFAGFRTKLDRARRYLSAREEMREYSTQVYALVRAYVVEAGARFAKRGELAKVDDVFMLHTEEMIDLAQGRLSGERAREIAALRRKLYDGYRDLAPPNELGRGVTLRADETLGASGVLRGVGCSPGVVEGPVRVVHSLDDAGSIRKGEILVTRFTDPGWTPVLGLVAGVVTEVGGMLSHAAVIGREYGIPAVLDVPGATKALRSGQRVRVDGTAGTVVLLGAGDAA